MAKVADSQRIGGLDGFVTAPIDDKGRVIIPAEMRGELSDGFVIRKARGKYLEVIRQDVYEQEVLAIRKLPDSIWKERYLRMARGTAFSGLKLDGNGRVVIPLSLRFLYKLEEKVTLVGAENRVEIWNPDDWREWLSDPSYGQDSEDLWFEIEMQMKRMQTEQESE